MGFIYLIKLSILTNSDTNEKVGKIGFTTNLKNRIDQYKNNFPELLFSKDLGDKANYYEGLIIKKFNEKFEVKQGKEYFELNEEEMINIIKTTISENYKPKEFYNPLEKNKTKKEVFQLIDKREEYINCYYCDYETNNILDYKKHLKEYHKHKEEVIEELVQEKKISEKIFPCEKCGKNYKTNQGLKKHMVNCMGVSNILECPHCHKILSSSGSKSRHMKVCKIKKATELVLKMEQNNTVNSNNTNIMNSNNTLNRNNVIIYNIGNNYKQRITNNEDSDDEFYEQIERNDFGNEKIEYISPEELEKKALNLDIKGLINEIYFNEEHPENQNIRKNCKKSLKVLKDHKWTVETKESIYNRMIIKTKGTLYLTAIDKLCYKMLSEIKTTELLDRFNNYEKEVNIKKIFDYIDIKLNEYFKKLKTLRLEFEERLKIEN
jgi:hypothetical protein